MELSHVTKTTRPSTLGVLLSANALAQVWDVTDRTILNWVQSERIKPFAYVGDRPVFHPTQVEKVPAPLPRGRRRGAKVG